MDVSWYVPPPPSNPEDINQETMWDGFEGPNSPGIIQAELFYDFHEDPPAGDVWQIVSQYQMHAGGPDSGPMVSSTPINVAQGHEIEGIMEIVNGAENTGGQGDEWIIETWDDTTEQATDLLVYTGPGNLPLTQAYLGILEAQGVYACDGLPDIGDNAQPFSVWELSQKSTGSGGWDSYNDVRSKVSLQAPGNSSGPPCEYIGWGWDDVGGNPYTVELWWDVSG
jgi:hypothetical protein